MRAGSLLAYEPWSAPREQVGPAMPADELGPESMRVSEAWGQDAVSVLPAGRTERVAASAAVGADTRLAVPRGPDRPRAVRARAVRALAEAV